MLHKIKSKLAERQRRFKEAEDSIPRWYIWRIARMMFAAVLLSAVMFWFMGQASMCNSIDGYYLPQEKNTGMMLYLECEEKPGYTQPDFSSVDISYNTSYISD